ncbi:MAG: hypothetical protein M1426_01210 [Patescibacteria group bacterium]|nr:hypothetical protein [Patescibacteria group bacterium]
MNERERYLETLLFGKPDKIPFQPGEPRESTLRVWHEQGLPAGRSWSDYVREKIEDHGATMSEKKLESNRFRKRQILPFHLNLK